MTMDGSAGIGGSLDDSAPKTMRRPSSSSQYLVLDRVNSYTQDVPLPRPRFWYILPLLGTADGITTLAFAAALVLRVGGSRQPQLLALLVWGIIRAALVVLGGSSRRVRETGWIVVGCALISALCALAQLNLIIQSRSWSRLPSRISLLQSLPPASPPPELLYAYCGTHVLFPLIHWLAFATIVGVSRDRNPYGLGLQTGIIRNPRESYREGVADLRVTWSSEDEEGEDAVERNGEGSEEDDRAWKKRMQSRRRRDEDAFGSEGETDIDHDEETGFDSQRRRKSSSYHAGLASDSSDPDHSDIPLDAARTPRRQRRRRQRQDSIGAEEQSFPTSSEEEETESESDPDDIIDIIPSPSVARHRTISHSQSFRSVRSRQSFVHQDDEEANGGAELDGSSQQIRPLSGYGTFRSLAGI